MNFKILKASFSLFLFLIAWCTGGTFPLQGSEWTIEGIDSNGTGSYSSLHFDKEGNAHVSYIVDDLGHLLKYAFWDHVEDKWFTMAIDEGASFCSLTLDSHQRPHISYADYGTASGSHLKYARWDGAKWRKETIPVDSDIIAYNTSVALDANDRPSISFYEYRGAKGSDFRIRLRVVSWNGRYWEVRTVDGTAGSGKFNSMAADPHGRLLLAYANVDSLTAGARFAIWDGRIWKTEVVDDMASNQLHTVGYSLAMALDKTGTPHLSYLDIDVSLVKYATLANGHWVTEVVGFTGKPLSDRNSIAVDEDGRPYITYYDGRYGQLHLAHKHGTGWGVEIVDGGFAGATSSLQIDHGVIWITYADESNHQLKVARRTLETHPSASREGKAAATTQTQAVEPEQLRRAR